MFIKLINEFVAGISSDFRNRGGNVQIGLFTILLTVLLSSDVAAGGLNNPLAKVDLKALTPPVEYTAPIENRPVGLPFTVPITVDDITGDGIFAFQFVITYDPAVIDPTGPNFGCSTFGTIAGAVGIGATCNITVNGSLNELRVSSFGAFPMNGSGTLLNISFVTDPLAVAGDVSPLTFSSGFFFNGSGLVPSTPHNGQITLVGTTAANTTVAGRVLNANGIPIPRTIVTLSNGNGAAFTSITNPFGYFRFLNVSTGNYTISLKSKRYNFTQRSIFVNSSAMSS